MKKNLLHILLGVLSCILSLPAQPTLSLLVNYSSRDTIRSGDPILLSLRLSNKTAEHVSMNNRIIRENLEKLRGKYENEEIEQAQYESEKDTLEQALQEEMPIELDEKEIHTKLHLVKNGQSVGASEFTSCWNDSNSPTIQLNSLNRWTAIYGIGGEQTKQWKNATYELYFLLDSLKSNTVVLIVQDSLPQSKSIMNADIDKGNYHLLCGNPEETLSIADQLLNEDPEWIDAVVLKADALNALDRSKEALELYEQGLRLFHRQFPRSYEAPEYLLDKISNLKKDR